MQYWCTHRTTAAVLLYYRAFAAVLLYLQSYCCTYRNTAVLKELLLQLGCTYIATAAVLLYLQSYCCSTAQCVANVIFLWRMNIRIYLLLPITHEWMSEYIQLSTFSQMNVRIYSSMQYIHQWIYKYIQMKNIDWILWQINING